LVVLTPFFAGLFVVGIFETVSVGGLTTVHRFSVSCNFAHRQTLLKQNWFLDLFFQWLFSFHSQRFHCHHLLKPAALPDFCSMLDHFAGVSGLDNSKRFVIQMEACSLEAVIFFFV
jgi:hypothetical protein